MCSEHDRLQLQAKHIPASSAIFNPPEHIGVAAKACRAAGDSSEPKTRATLSPLRPGPADRAKPWKVASVKRLRPPIDVSGAEKIRASRPEVGADRGRRVLVSGHDALPWSGTVAGQRKGMLQGERGGLWRERMKRYSIMVMEYGSDREVEFIQVDTNPENIVAGLRTKKLKVFKDNMQAKRSRVQKYSCRIVDHGADDARKT